MKLTHKTFGVLALTVTAAFAHGDTYGNGNAGVFLEVVDQGPDLTFSYNVPGLAGFWWSDTQGWATASYSDYASAGAEYTTSMSEVFGLGGEASEISGYGMEIDVFNDSRTPETVEFFWEGSTFAESYSDDPQESSTDTAYAGLFDSSVGNWVEYIQSDSSSGGTTSGSDFYSDYYVATIAPDSTVYIVAEAYNEGVSNSSSTPGPAALAPFGIGLISVARRRSRKRA